ncbi:MAG: sarcosine oxidase subunit beta [Halieaceae bacterium]|jgi:sarcosine oxidase subunit beta
MKSYDIVVVGAGIIGLCIAWQLRRRSNLKILVLDKANSVGQGSTGASSAVCRFRYSTDDMVYLARDGILAYQHWEEFVGLSSPRARFHAHGTLWLPGADREWAVRENRRMQGLGIRTVVLDDDELRQRYPALSPCVVAPDTITAEEHDCTGGGRHYLELDGGYMDPVDCAEDLVQACRENQVDVLFNAPVARVEVESGKVTGVTLEDGTGIVAPVVVNASGPWCRKLNESAGLEMPWNLSPTRIQVFHVDLPTDFPGPIPVTVDMVSGVYFRSQNRGQQLVVGSILASDEQERVSDPDNYNQFPDDDFVNRQLHRLHHRLPSLPYRGKIRGYCGLYTVNEQDVHPIVGGTDVEGLYVANGLSGHGFKLAPAIGSQLAQLITSSTCEFDTGVSAEIFAIDRAPISVANKSVLA